MEEPGHGVEGGEEGAGAEGGGWGDDKEGAGEGKAGAGGEGEADSGAECEAISIKVGGTEAERACILGTTGAGKSFLIKKIVAGTSCSVIYDIRKQHMDIPGSVIINNPDVLKQYIEQKPTFRIVYQPSTLDEPEFARVTYICYMRGDMLYVVEEANEFAKGQIITPEYRRAIAWGRMRGFAVVSATQRCAELHKMVIAQSQHVFVFYNFLPNDVDYLNEFLPPDAVQAVTELGDSHDFIWWNRKTWRRCRV